MTIYHDLTIDQRGEQLFPEEFKAYKEGKQIQFDMGSETHANWQDCKGMDAVPLWFPSLKYRVKP